MSASSLGGGRYFINFIDNYSRFCWTYIMTHKSEAFENFLNFKATAERQSGRKLITLCTDNGGEYNSHAFQEHCTRQGITHQFTTPYSSAQNGVAERKNRTLQNVARAMLKQSGLNISYWAYPRQRIYRTYCQVRPLLARPPMSYGIRRNLR